MLPEEKFPDEGYGAAAEVPLRSRVGAGAEGLAAQVAAWLAAHQGEFFECDRHNGRARMTARACAERYRRAMSGWVDQLSLNPERRHVLKLSFSVCAGCPLGARNAWAGRRRGKTTTRKGSFRLASGAALGRSSGHPAQLAVSPRPTWG
jgi:hypothetical protein